MSIKELFKNISEQFKNKKSYSSNLPESVSNRLESKLGIQIEGEKEIGGYRCLHSDLCLIYCPNNKSEGDLRVSFDVRSSLEQVAFIMSELVDMYGKDNVNILKSYYFESDREDSMLIGEEAYKKYFEHLTGVISTKIAQQQFDRLMILEKFDPSRMQ